MKIYKITLISAYEEVYLDDKKIDFKKLNSDLELNEKQTHKTEFLKKISKRSIIKDHTKMTEFVFNPDKEQLGFRNSRYMMYFLTLKEAESALMKNYADIWEGGSWGRTSFAVIEEYLPGFHLVEKSWFYQSQVSEKYSKKDNSTRIKIKVAQY